MPEPNRPFRWDPVRPDHLGTLPADPPDLWYVDDLVECAGQVLARCADSDLYLVGRSADSVFDLLSGALEHTTWRDRLHQVPLSVFGSYRVSGDDLPPLRAKAGRQRRAQLVAVLCEEPTIREPWLRSLVNEIRA